MFISPWGRNYRSMYADTKEITPAPYLFDDFEVTNQAWHSISGQWNTSNGSYNQTDPSVSWKDSARDNVPGDYSDYTVSAKVKQELNSGGSISAVGITFRRQDNNNFYLVDLYKDGSTNGRVRLFRKQNGVWQTLSVDDCAWQEGIWYELKASVFGDNIEVHVDNMRQSLNFQRRFNQSLWQAPYEDPFDISHFPYVHDDTFSSGGVGLASMGGKHSFDDFRVQNEFLYGETDAMDCINQFMEEVGVSGELKPDPTRIYLSGFSMGGLGAWNLALHYPDIFAAVEPGVGCTDLETGLDWIKSSWPDVTFDPQGNPIYCSEQDGHIYENCVALLDGLPESENELIKSGLHEHSARCILENAYNTSIRIEHPEYDALIPNVDPDKIASGQRAKVSINHLTQGWYFDWWQWRWLWGTGFQEQYKATPTYANSQYIWNLWDSKSSLRDADCPRQTFRQDPVTGEILGDVGLWDFTNYSDDYIWGAHGGGMCVDLIHPQNTLSFFYNTASSFYNEHLNPPTVAYKTYDNEHTTAWWLDMEIVSPDEDKPGLARVGVSGNTVDAHVKNVKNLTLDLTRMGINTKNAGTITINLDRSTEPFEAYQPPEQPITTDTAWNKKVTLELVGQWYPNAAYTINKTNSKTGTVITVPNIDITNPTTLTIGVPAGLNDKDFFNFQTDPTYVDWWPISGGTGTLVWDNLEAGHSNGGTPGSLRIKDVDTNGSPYLSMWAPSSTDFISVTPYTSYTASAFVKTRLLSAKNKVIQNGKYVELDPSVAGIGIYWYRSDKSFLSSNLSLGIRGTNDWTAQEVRLAAPQYAAYAKVILFVKEDPDNTQGTSGSAWFDDVRFSKSNGAN
jgi:hypothetical protein